MVSAGIARHFEQLLVGQGFEIDSWIVGWHLVLLRRGGEEGFYVAGYLATADERAASLDEDSDSIHAASSLAVAGNREQFFVGQFV
jgi:hypothetical protein